MYICIVTKGINIETVRRTFKHVSLASVFDRRLEIVILADAPCAPELLDLGARVEVTPTDFVTEKARFKARSLEYFRAAVNLQAENWVLHLDEESMVDENVLRACVDFIEKGEYDFGQGIILYNDQNYWRNPLLTIIDIPRVTDDLGKLYFQDRVMHQSIWGVRGSFLLVSGRLEYAAGWETECRAEDYDFAWRVRNPLSADLRPCSLTSST
ncbi:MAG: hypothetical protein Q9190_004764 [Brigantiaea leucoxantha]